METAPKMVSGCFRCRIISLADLPADPTLARSMVQEAHGEMMKTSQAVAWHGAVRVEL